jgi:hypothetical protein
MKMFCKTVWNGLHILPDGYIRLCSIGENTRADLDMQRARDKDGVAMHILTHDIKDIMNSDKHKQVRALNIKDPTAWSPHCDCCENREMVTGFDRTHPNKSRRIYLMGVEDGLNENNFAKLAKEDGTIDWMPSSLDIRFGNLCNQKCIMCNAAFSNLWYEEHFEFFKTNSFGQSTQITVTKDLKSGKWLEPPELQWFEDPRWWPKFETMMPFLKHIYITGGEPMVTPAHDIMLDKLIESGFAKNIWLEYDSNCSAVNNKIVERWYHFKRVDIRASADAIENQYEVIRFGGKWEKFVTNIRKLKQYQKESNNKIRLMNVSTCFQIATSMSIIETEEWCKKEGVDFHMRFLTGPSYHAVSSLSDAAKLKLRDHYAQHVDTSQKALMIVKYLNNQLGKHKPSAVEQFKKFMDFLDTTRNTDWKKTFPDIIDLLN